MTALYYLGKSLSTVRPLTPLWRLQSTLPLSALNAGGVMELPAEGLSPRPVFVGHVAGDASKGRLAPKPWLVGHVVALDPFRAEC